MSYLKQHAENLIFLLFFLISDNEWQHITGILKSVFKIPPLPLYNVGDHNIAWRKFCSLFPNIVKSGEGGRNTKLPKFLSTVTFYKMKTNWVLTQWHYFYFSLFFYWSKSNDNFENIRKSFKPSDISRAFGRPVCRFRHSNSREGEVVRSERSWSWI